MANYYVYLISSLPSLTFGVKPPISFGGLLKACEGLIPDRDMAIIRALAGPEVDCPKTENITLRKWSSFETMLRNELVKIRAARKKMDPVKYLREDGCAESFYAAHIAINAYRKMSLSESEKALDADRWKYLEELAIGHYFDLDLLITYAIK